jgi:hypothetical protein
MADRQPELRCVNSVADVKQYGRRAALDFSLYCMCAFSAYPSSHLTPIIDYKYASLYPQSTYRGRVEIREVSAICPLSLSLHHNFVRDSRYSEKGWTYVHPPPQFSIMIEFTPERGHRTLCLYPME